MLAAGQAVWARFGQSVRRGASYPAFGGFARLRPPLPAGDAGGPVLTPSGGTAESPQVDAARGQIAAIEGP
jgi:hypothetical protein